MAERLCKNCMWWGFDHPPGLPLPAKAVCAEKTQQQAEAGHDLIVKTAPGETCDDFELSSAVLE